MKIIAHRGACGYEPENTLAAFKKAIAQHADAIELDVHVLKDGELAVIHDHMVDRTTNGTGYVADLDLREIRRLDAGGGQKVPLLHEVFDLVDKRLPIHIELKGPETAVPVAALISTYMTKKNWPEDLFIVSSYNHVELMKFTHLMPAIRTGALFYGIPLEHAAFTEQLGSSSLHLSTDLITQELVEDAHARGLEVFVETINNKSEMQRMYDLGIEGIFTNFPDKARSYLASIRGEFSV